MKKIYRAGLLAWGLLLVGVSHVHSGQQPHQEQNFLWAPKHRTVTNPATGDSVNLDRTYVDEHIARYRPEIGTPPPNDEICTVSPDICVLHNPGR